MNRLAGHVRHRLSAIVLTVIGGVTYTAFYQPILFSDDWSYLVMPMAQHSINWFSAADRRPLVNAPAAFLQTLVGLNIDALVRIELAKLL